MVDFSNLKAAEIAGRTAEYELIELADKPVLIVRPTGPDNKPYFNALLREFGGDQRRLQRGRLDGGMLEKMRDVNRKLFPEYVVAGWRGVKDMSGKDVPFALDNVKAFFEVLPGYILDGLRSFCEAPESFIGQELVDSEEVGGNSAGS